MPQRHCWGTGWDGGNWEGGWGYRKQSKESRTGLGESFGEGSKGSAIWWAGEQHRQTGSVAPDIWPASSLLNIDRNGLLCSNITGARELEEQDNDGLQIRHSVSGRYLLYTILASSTWTKITDSERKKGMKKRKRMLSLKKKNQAMLKATVQDQARQSSQRPITMTKHLMYTGYKG